MLEHLTLPGVLAPVQVDTLLEQVVEGIVGGGP